MAIPELLLHSLEDLVDEDFKTFKWHLINPPDGYKPFPKSQLEHAERRDVVSKMIQNYGKENAVKATVTILKKQRMNDIAEKLLNACVGGVMLSPVPTTTPASSNAPPAAAAATSLSADNGSVIIAPTINNSSPGTWNITLTKN